MNIEEMTRLGGKGKKKTRLTVLVECESRREARNIQLCVMEFLKEDINVDQRKIKANLEDSDGK